MNTVSRYELNEDSLKRAMMLGGAPVGMGILSVIMMISRLVNGIPVGVLLPVVTVLTLGLGGYLLTQLWPVFRWVELSDEGIRISYKDENFWLDWSDIARIEQFGEPTDDEIVPTLFLATDEDQGHVLDKVTVNHFGQLVGQLRERSREHSISWVVPSADETVN